MFAIMAGLCSAFLLWLVQTGFLGGIFPAYLPYFPLMIGLYYGGNSITAAVLAGFIAMIVFSGFSGGAVLSFVMLYGAPMLIVGKTLLGLRLPMGRYPVGGMLTAISLYAAMMTLISVLAFYDPVQGMAGLFPADNAMPEWMEEALATMQRYPYLVIGLAVWMHIIVFYGCLVLANYLLSGWRAPLLPSLALKPFMPSLLVLVVVLLMGGLTMVDEPALAVAAKSAFVVLLLPYCLMGVATMHHYLQPFPSKYPLLILVYVITVLVFLPIFCFLLYGLFRQVIFLSNRFSDGATGE